VKQTRMGRSNRIAGRSKLLGKEIKYTGHNFDKWEEQMRANAPSS